VISDGCGVRGDDDGSGGGDDGDIPNDVMSQHGGMYHYIGKHR